MSSMFFYWACVFKLWLCARNRIINGLLWIIRGDSPRDCVNRDDYWWIVRSWPKIVIDGKPFIISYICQGFNANLMQLHWMMEVSLFCIDPSRIHKNLFFIWCGELVNATRQSLGCLCQVWGVNYTSIHVTMLYILTVAWQISAGSKKKSILE